ncbi:MAG: arginine repressor [Clostridia bacterium]|nr:arginine repressor [Clostridia bacterium]
MKTSRQSVILQIIAETDIETQAQLIEALAERGVSSTQATLSRDIKDLQLVKELGENGKYHYVVSGKSKNSDHEVRLKKIFRESVTSICVAQNLIIIKTLPGLASAACSTLDTMHIENLAGTLAGDDTAFIAMKDNESAENFCKMIEDMM